MSKENNDLEFFEELPEDLSELKIDITDEQIKELEDGLEDAERQIQLMQKKVDYIRFLLSTAKKLKKERQEENKSN